MKIIAHRGNIFGPSRDENRPEHIDRAISLGYDVEVDIHVDQETLLLGHDSGIYKVDMAWLTERKNRLWIHCKNFNALSLLSATDFNYFYHIDDPYTITSLGYIWTYPGQQFTQNFVLVIPEIANIIPQKNIECCAVCTDYAHDWRLQ